MIDIHSHLLPGLDDGAEDLAEALDMARLATADGIRRVVCSPHVYDGRLGRGQDPSTLAGRVTELAAAFTRQDIPLELDFWSEIWLTPEVLDDIDRLPIMTAPALGAAAGGAASGEAAGNGAAPRRYALIEFGLNEAPRRLEEYFFRLLAQDIVPVIAHPERVHAAIQSPDVALEWIEQGCLLQLNAGSLTGLFGQRAKQTAEWLLLSGAAHFMGTDAHSSSGRKPELSRAVALASALIGKDEAWRLVDGNPRALLAGEQVTPIHPDGAQASAASAMALAARERDGATGGGAGFLSRWLGRRLQRGRGRHPRRN